jgi:hypothetical protein
MISTIPVITGYIIVISMSYLMGYWGEFGINYLEYITITEVAVVALSSLLPTVGIMLLGSFISHIYMGKFFKVGERRNTTEGKLVNRWWKIITFPFVILIFYGVYADKQLLMLGITSLCGPILGIWLANEGALQNIIENHEIRFSVVFIAVMLIFLSYPTGYR